MAVVVTGETYHQQNIPDTGFMNLEIKRKTTQISQIIASQSAGRKQWSWTLYIFAMCSSIASINQSNTQSRGL